MTCIVGLTHEGYVYMGGDRGASDGDSIISMKNPKVESKGNWVYGYAGTIGIGQLLSFIDLPAEVENPFAYIRLELVELLKDSIETFTNPTTEHDTSWLIGYKDRLFELSAADWGVLELDYTSIGSGSQYALGSLYTSIDEDPIYRIGLSLGAAIQYSPTCQAPIDVVSTDITKLP